MGESGDDKRGKLACMNFDMKLTINWLCLAFLQSGLQLRFKNGKSRIADDVKAADVFNELPSLHPLLQRFPHFLH